MDPPSAGAVRQTFNQTKGGQFANWASIDAWCAKAWKRFVDELDLFIAREGHTDVLQRHVSPSGYPLGQTLQSVRQGVMLDGRPDEAERRALLEAKGIKMYNVLKEMHDASYTEFQKKMDTYVTETGTSRVQQRYTTEDGYPLGMRVNSVKTYGTYLKTKPDERARADWFEALPGWKWSGTYQPPGFQGTIVDEPWEEFQKRMQTYVDDQKTSRVPNDYTTKDGYPLGRRVDHVKSRGTYLKTKPDERARADWFEALPGWRWSGAYKPPGFRGTIVDEPWEEFQERMHTYVAKHETSRVQQRYKTKDGYPLGMRVNSVKTYGTYLKTKPDERARADWFEALPGWKWSGTYQPPRRQPKFVMTPERKRKFDEDRKREVDERIRRFMEATKRHEAAKAARAAAGYDDESDDDDETDDE